MSMKLTVLVDNNTIIDRYLLGEPAVSFFIESRGRRVLFDTGYSDVFLENADRLGIDLSDLDAVVRSLVLGPAAGTQTATRRVKGLSAAARHFWPHVSTASDDVTAGPGVTAWTAAVWTGRQARRPETSSTARGSHRRPPARPERTAQRACRDPPGRATRTLSAARARAR